MVLVIENLELVVVKVGCIRDCCDRERREGRIGFGFEYSTDERGL